MPFVRARDLVVHFAFDGPPDAPVVLLVNSLGTNFHLWDEQIEPLAATRRVLRYDMRGHGLTTTANGPLPTATRVEELADDAVALLDALRIARASVVGLSIGGLVTQRLAAAYPQRVERAMLCATGSRMGTVDGWNERIATVEREGVGAIVEATMGRWFTTRTRAERPELVRGFSAMLLSTPRAGYVAGCHAVRDADLRADDARIACPVLVITGEGDPTAPPDVGTALRDAIPNAEFALITGASHLLCVEQPAATNAMLLRFLEDER
ncbi:MAG: 3-oxoadipate enol-lactonase [Candidatus Eremiobacteraeota bacterium]|nr:3-oxoadipate enol-lactonase [Candidatus Eremiobacteraeota bacterium]MBV9408371.1 3-oxoadipate enol-lactonase [Candidatus Eremiobacteraeota bacterium]